MLAADRTGYVPVMADLPFPRAVLTHLNAGVRTDAGVLEPVLMTSWEHPARLFTCPKHCRPSLITAHSGSRLRLAKMEIACPQKLVTRRNFSRTGLPTRGGFDRDKRRLAGGTSSTFAAGPLTSEMGVVEFNASGQRLAGHRVRA